MKYYLAIKSNKNVPFVEMWMDLEIVIKSEVSQKKKNKYILMHICGIYKNSIDDLTCKVERDTDVENKGMDKKA